MVKEIEYKKSNIKELFELWFRIPKYQRPYVWESDNVTELLDDIKSAQEYDPKSEYFLGSFVFNIDNSEDYTQYDLLDGQQRLTTLFLIFAVARDLTENIKLKNGLSKGIYQEEDEIYNIPGRLRIKFDIRKDVEEFVDKYIKEEYATLKEKELNEIINSNKVDISIKNMTNAILTIKEYFKKNNINLVKYFKYLLNKVLVIYVASEDLDDAFKLFTVLNDRGVKLRSSDILKAENLKEVKKEKQEEYAILWESLENQFGDNFDEFLSYIRTILVKTKARKNLLDEFKEIYEKGLIKKGEEFFDLIKKYRDIYNSVLEEEYYFKYFKNYDIYNLLVVMKETFPSNIWIPPLLKYFEKYRYEKIDIFIKKLEKKASYEWIIPEYTPTKRIENMNSIIKLIENSKSPEDVINNNILNQIDIEKLKNILNEDIYGKRFAKFILFKLEYIRSGEKNVPLNFPKYISIEHILPQNPENNSNWVKDFSEEDRNYWTNKLGNLVLISRTKNASLSRLDFKDKKEKYFKKSTEVFPCISRIMRDNDTWNLDNLKRNHEEQLNSLLEYYKS